MPKQMEHEMFHEKKNKIMNKIIIYKIILWSQIYLEKNTHFLPFDFVGNARGHMCYKFHFLWDPSEIVNM